MELKHNHVLRYFRYFGTKLKKPTDKSKSVLRSDKLTKKSQNSKLNDSKSNNKTFNELFLNTNLNSKSNNADTQNHKISEEGSFNALYEECMNRIFEQRKELSFNFGESKEVESLNKFEDKIVKNVFNRLYNNNLDNFKTHLDNFNSPDNFKDNVNPYWSPFRNIGNLKLEIVSEFNQLSKLVNNVELYKYKLMIKKSLKSTRTAHDSNFWETNVEDNYVNKNDLFWDPHVSKALVLRNHKRPFCFRDLNVLHYFVAENGQVLPRRINQTSRQQQKQVFRAVSTAKKLLLMPYDWKPLSRDRVPLMYPVQYLFDELFHKWEKQDDLRAQQMLNLLVAKFPHVNAHRYFRALAKGLEAGAGTESTEERGKRTEKNF